MSGKLAHLFEKLTHGVYVVGVAAAERRNAFTAAWIMQTSFAPPMIALSINPAHSSYRLLQQSRAFTVSVLGNGQEALARHFGQPAAVDKLAGVNWRAGRSGAPILEDAVAWLECELAGECPAGDHVIAVGRVVAGGIVSPTAIPMNYRDTGDMDGSVALFPDTFEPS